MSIGRNLNTMLVAAALLGAGLLPASAAELQMPRAHVAVVPAKKVVRHRLVRLAELTAPVRISHGYPLVLGIAY